MVAAAAATATGSGSGPATAESEASHKASTAKADPPICGFMSQNDGIMVIGKAVSERKTFVSSTYSGQQGAALH